MISDSVKLALIRTAPTLSHIDLIELVVDECEFAQQRTWVGLTDEEIERDFYGRYDFVRSIEAKLKEKNT